MFSCSPWAPEQAVRKCLGVARAGKPNVQCRYIRRERQSKGGWIVVQMLS